jgi:hypothetical protein
MAEQVNTTFDRRLQSLSAENDNVIAPSIQITSSSGSTIPILIEQTL